MKVFVYLAVDLQHEMAYGLLQKCEIHERSEEDRHELTLKPDDIEIAHERMPPHVWRRTL